MMKLRHSYWLWPYRPDTLPLVLLLALTAYAFVWGGYWASNAPTIYGLQQLIQDYHSQKKEMITYLSIAKQRTMTNSELDSLNRLSLGFLDKLPSKHTERETKEWTPNSASAIAPKMKQLEAGREYIVSSIETSGLSGYSTMVGLALTFIPFGVILSRGLLMASVFRPREIAISNKHPIFGILMAEAFAWIVTGAAAASLVTANTYDSINQLISSLDSLNKIEGLGGGDYSSLHYKFSSDTSVYRVLFDQENPKQLSSELVFLLVMLCSVLVIAMVARRIQNPIALWTIVIPAASWFISMNSLLTEPRQSEPIIFDLHVLSISLTRSSKLFIAAAAASVLLLYFGRASRFRAALYTGYGGLVTTSAWLLLSSIAIFEKSASAFIVTIAISFCLIVLVERCARLAVTSRMYDPS